MATIKDIALKAGVSISTVSYILNNTKNVRPETRQRVMAVIEEMNYYPSALAVSMKTKRTQTIGIIVPDISNMFFTEIIRGIEDYANQFGYSVILCNSDENQQKEKKYINTLFKKEIDGLIFVGTGKNPDILKKKKDMPIVIVDRKIGNEFSSVMVNNINGGFMATEYLIQKNKTSVYLLTGPLKLSTYFDRMTGYRQALNAYNVNYNESYVVECQVSHEGGYQGVEQILQRGQEVRSIFAANDLIALGAMKALVHKGYRIPEDVSVVGYDDIPTASIVIPALTTIEQPKYMMGEKAAENLIRQMSQTQIQPEHIELEARLIIRESS